MIFRKCVVSDRFSKNDYFLIDFQKILVSENMRGHKTIFDNLWKKLLFVFSSSDTTLFKTCLNAPIAILVVELRRCVHTHRTFIAQYINHSC